MKGLDGKTHHSQRHVLSFPGRRNWAIVPNLHPFSEYQLRVAAYNTKGDGPESSTISFYTPEGGKSKQFNQHHFMELHVESYFLAL